MDAPENSHRPNAGRRPRARRRCRVFGLLHDRRGATAVEYGFVVALIVLAMIGALADVGNTTSSMWNNINAKVTNAG